MMSEELTAASIGAVINALEHKCLWEESGELVRKLWGEYANALIDVAELEAQLEKESDDSVRSARMYLDAQAKIDMLMLEYCPEEMTEKQKKFWAMRQVPVSSKQEKETLAALNEPT